MNLSVRLESTTPVRISDRHGVSKHHFQNGPVPLRFTTGDDLINWSLSVRMRSVPVRFWGDLQALFLVLWAVNIQELSPNSIARLCVCLPIIPELSKCDMPWKFLYLGRRGGWLALQKLNIMQECPYSINIIINKSFIINSISMTLTSGPPSGVRDCQS